MFETETVKYKTNTDCYWILLEDICFSLKLRSLIIPHILSFYVTNNEKRESDKQWSAG